MINQVVYENKVTSQDDEPALCNSRQLPRRVDLKILLLAILSLEAVYSVEFMLNAA